jgi:hypothetical protein
VLGCTKPASHRLHDVVPLSGCTHPLGQFAHVSSPSLLYEPRSHDLKHDVWPAVGCTQPLGQFVHVSLPSLLYEPISHDK